MTLNPEPCNHPSCERTVEGPHWRGKRCGGIMFGTVNDPGIGCGKFFCDQHLVGLSGPFYCRPCWEAAKKAGKVRSSAARVGKEYEDPQGRVWTVTEITEPNKSVCAEYLDGRVRERNFWTSHEWAHAGMARVRCCGECQRFRYEYPHSLCLEGVEGVGASTCSCPLFVKDPPLEEAS